jgi:hypothetical protein
LLVSVSVANQFDLTSFCSTLCKPPILRTWLTLFLNELSWTLKVLLFLKMASLCQYFNFLT